MAERSYELCVMMYVQHTEKVRVRECSARELKKPKTPLVFRRFLFSFVFKISLEFGNEF